MSAQTMAVFEREWQAVRWGWDHRVIDEDEWRARRAALMDLRQVTLINQRRQSSQS